MNKDVLIVDDIEDDLKLMADILEKESFRVVTALNGAEALDLLKGNGFDLILLDVNPAF